MNIATALNRKYIRYTAVMLASLCENNPVHIDAYLLNSELTSEDISDMARALAKYDISIIPVGIDRMRFSDKLPRSTQWSIETYFRLMLTDILPDSVERIFYLDGDLIINRSLEDFYSVDFAGDEIIAAEDSNGKRGYASFSQKQTEMLSDKMKQGYRYFNAGVMLMNIAELRKKHSFVSYMKMALEWDYKMTAPDQDILNYAHWDHVGYVGWREFDLFARIAHNDGLTYEQVKSDTAVVHYAGDKPWNGDNCHFDIEQLWWDYAKLTPYYNGLLEEFQQKMMMDTTVEKYILRILEEKQELYDKIQEFCEKLSK